MATLQNRFSALFEESDISQEEFGKLFGVSKSQIFNWRNGRGEPDTEMLKNIAHTCKVSVEWLIGNSNTRSQITIIAEHQTDYLMDDLPPEAIERIEEFKDLMRMKYGKKNS